MKRKKVIKLLEALKQEFIDDIDRTVSEQGNEIDNAKYENAFACEIRMAAIEDARDAVQYLIDSLRPQVITTD